MQCQSPRDTSLPSHENFADEYRPEVRCLIECLLQSVEHGVLVCVSLSHLSLDERTNLGQKNEQLVQNGPIHTLLRRMHLQRNW